MSADETCIRHEAGLREVTRQREALADALAALFKLIEDGSLVRDTTHDLAEGFAMKAMNLVMVLKRAHDALREAGRLP